MSGLTICLFIAFLAIVDVGTVYRGTYVGFDDEYKLKSIPGDWDVEDPAIVINIEVFNVNVDKINTGAFKNFTNLEELWLTGIITAIEDDAFTGMDKLERITLREVGIQHIGPKVFHNLNSLTWLEIARNEIKEIHLTNLPLLTELYISQNDITEVSNDTFVNLKNLKAIDLSENKIRALKDWAFKGCPSLTNLNLNKNQITDIERNTFRELLKLKELSLSYNNLTTLTKDLFRELRNLNRLDLSHNLINEIDAISNFYFIPLTYLDYLDLSHNNITTLPRDLLFRLTELTDVRLNHNTITSLSQSFFLYTPKLEYLDLGFNLIKKIYLPDKLEKLKRVSLHHNKLQSIKLSAKTRRNIDFLDLSDNNLTHLDESFQHLINLQDLYLSNNKLKSFSLCIPGSLTNLDLSENELHGITLDKFCDSATQGKLRIVDLSFNQFTSYNLTYTNKSLQETQPDLYEIDLSVNLLNADSLKQIQNSELRHIALLKIEPQRKVDVNINLNENMNGEGNTTWIVVTSAALAVGVFAVIAAMLVVCKERRRTNLNPNVNDAVMLDELYDDVGPARADDDGRSSPDYDYPRFPPLYDDVGVQPTYLAVLPDPDPGPQQLEQQDNGPEENIYEEID